MFKIVACLPDGDAYTVVVEGTEPGESADVARCRAAAVEHMRKLVGTPVVREHNPKLAGATVGQGGFAVVPAGQPVQLQQSFKIGARV